MEVAYRKQLDEYLEKIDSVIENGRYKDNWESLSAYPVPTWYKNAKFGVFLHWGVYSVPAYYSEWYPRLCITRATLFIGIIKRNTARILITVILYQCLRQKNLMQKNGSAF